jgi:hypothetical protein
MGLALQSFSLAPSHPSETAHGFFALKSVVVFFSALLNVPLKHTPVW